MDINEVMWYERQAENSARHESLAEERLREIKRLETLLKEANERFESYQNSIDNALDRPRKYSGGILANHLEAIRELRYRR